ncbi:MAG: glycine cleavage system aminomethyltransferase GcvT [Melioribacteraceae bacterium]|nr:glycine cleavage system aminomethyltransferase GcvT [Melioribacteraceae bacterium]
MKTTKFLKIHESLNAKLVDFAGFQMPVHYSSIIDEHKSVRNSVGVFDVSHMGEVIIKGEKALDFVQHITINDASKLNIGRVQYSAMCYKDGGIVDDLLVYKIADDEYMLVVNGANKDKDFEWMNKNNSFGVDINDESDEYSLLAIQGSNSKQTLDKICSKELDMEYYHFFKAEVAGIEMIVSRTGYTGELGYEIYFKGDETVAEKVWAAIFEAGAEFEIKPIGLGARDSLRLEMGFCLYGNDIDQNTNPLEAGLNWITKLKKGDFVGRDSLVKIKEEGVSRKLVPIIAESRAFPRNGYEISVNDEIVGNVTSGTVSPVLEKPIALAYVKKELAVEGNRVNMIIRGKEIPCIITKLPFVKK